MSHQFVQNFGTLGMKVDFAGTPEQQDALLTAWGLTREPLCEAVLYALGHYNDCTSFDPRGFNLGIAYARAARRLRELLIPTRFWIRDDMNNQTAIRNENLRLRLYPCNFCDAAADPERMPTNLSEKGNAARDDTLKNPTLFDYGLDHVVPDAVAKIVNGYTTLVLGMNFEGEFPRAEVSMPVEFMNNQFTAFAPRVPIFDGRTPPTSRPVKTSDSDVFGEVDIPIRMVS